MEIPKNRHDNLVYRCQLNHNCEQDPKNPQIIDIVFKRNIVAFFDSCLFTYDPRQEIKDQPFILWEYQEDYVKKLNQHIEDGESLLTEKSRDMGATWCILGVFIYRWIMFSDNFLIGSRKEELVDKIGNMDTMFERLRYMIRCLPDWLKDYHNIKQINSAFMKIWKDDGSSIIGESMNENFSRQGRYNAILLDEFAFVNFSERIWTACGDSSPCKFPVSTPSGKHNTFARLRHSGMIKVYSMHWRLHPDKDDAWYARQRLIRGDRDVAQELDINYISSSGKPFYGGFVRAIHARKIHNISESNLILGWDYGYHHPCCVVTQIDVKGRWNILDCLFGENELIQEFGERVKQFLNENYPDQRIRSWGDPAGNQESDKSRRTSVQILGEMGFEVFSRPSNTSQTNYDARKTIIEGKLKQLIDGIPALTVNDIPRTEIIIEAFEGGLHYPEEDKNGFVRDYPVRDGYFEHPANCIDYIAVNEFSSIQSQDNFNYSKPHKVAIAMGSY